MVEEVREEESPEYLSSMITTVTSIHGKSTRKPHKLNELDPVNDALEVAGVGLSVAAGDKDGADPARNDCKPASWLDTIETISKFVPN